MTVYLDLVILINFIMDFYILSGVKFLLKLPTKIFRIILGSLVGSLSILLLFLKLSTIEINLLKFIISLLMILTTFGKSRIFYNLFYLYIISIVLGGTIYFINDSLGYKVEGYLFINKGYSINILILLILSPIIIFLYIKDFLRLKKRIKTIYKVIIRFKNKELKLTGFLDTGNHLIDPYLHRPIILISKKLIDLRGKKILYVPFNSLNNSSILKCINCEYIIIDNKKYNNVLIGINEVNLNEDCILNERLFSI